MRRATTLRHASTNKIYILSAGRPLPSLLSNRVHFLAVNMIEWTVLLNVHVLECGGGTCAPEMVAGVKVKVPG